MTKDANVLIANAKVVVALDAKNDFFFVKSVLNKGDMNNKFTVYHKYVFHILLAKNYNDDHKFFFFLY